MINLLKLSNILDLLTPKHGVALTKTPVTTSQNIEDPEKPEPPEMKEEEEELSISPGEEQVVLKTEAETFMVTADLEKRRPTRDRVLCQSSPEAQNQNQDQVGSRTVDLGSCGEEESKQKTSSQPRDQGDSVDCPDLKRLKRSHTGEKVFTQVV